MRTQTSCTLSNFRFLVKSMSKIFSSVRILQCIYPRPTSSSLSRRCITRIAVCCRLQVPLSFCSRLLSIPGHPFVEVLFCYSNLNSAAQLSTASYPFQFFAGITRLCLYSSSSSCLCLGSTSVPPRFCSSSSRFGPDSCSSVPPACSEPLITSLPFLDGYFPRPRQCVIPLPHPVRLRRRCPLYWVHIIQQGPALESSSSVSVSVCFSKIRPPLLSGSFLVFLPSTGCIKMWLQRVRYHASALVIDYSSRLLSLSPSSLFSHQPVAFHRSILASSRCLVFEAQFFLLYFRPRSPPVVSIPIFVKHVVDIFLFSRRQWLRSHT